MKKNLLAKSQIFFFNFPYILRIPWNSPYIIKEEREKYFPLCTAPSWRWKVETFGAMEICSFESFIINFNI